MVSTNTPDINRHDWLILDALSDDYESVEQIAQLVQPEWTSPDSLEIIDRLERLYSAGHVFLTLDSTFDRAAMIREIAETRDRKFWFGRTPSGHALWQKHSGGYRAE